MSDKIFVKVYVDAVKSGMIADMGADNWQTLCVIASYMDKDSECFPTHAQIAKGLGVRRETATRRVKKLTDYRWQGMKIIEKVKSRTVEGKWDNTRYTILPLSQIRIFKNEPEDIPVKE